MSNIVRQSAAIPVMDGRVCMITSSNGRRWVFPKGRIDPGHTAGEAAMIEAWEEAGLVGVLEPAAVGSYWYSKLGRRMHVSVHIMTVTEQAESWPESALRDREWVTVAEALSRIDEPGLRAIVREQFGVLTPQSL